MTPRLSQKNIINTVAIVTLAGAVFSATGCGDNINNGDNAKNSDLTTYGSVDPSLIRMADYIKTQLFNNGDTNDFVDIAITGEPVNKKINDSRPHWDKGWDDCNNVKIIINQQGLSDFPVTLFYKKVNVKTIWEQKPDQIVVANNVKSFGSTADVKQIASIARLMKTMLTKAGFSGQHALFEKTSGGWLTSDSKAGTKPLIINYGNGHYGFFDFKYDGSKPIDKNYYESATRIFGQAGKLDGPKLISRQMVNT